jgi:hypothetical protein
MIRSFAAVLIATAATAAPLRGQAPDTTSGGAAAPRSPFLPDTVLTPPGGPRALLLGAPRQGVAALRLAVPLTEGPVEAGAAAVLRDLALERMEALARPVGARVSASRTPWGLAYAVEGASADFEYLAYLLRQAVARPDVEGAGFREARLRLQEQTEASLETPSARIASDLHHQVAPDIPPLTGTPASVEALDPARVLSVWRRTHQASSMTLLVSAAVMPEVVLAATRGMGAPASEAAGPLDAPAPPEADAAKVQTLRIWYGKAWVGGDAEDPTGLVAAVLVSRYLEEHTGDFEAGTELWELPMRWALVVTGAAYPRQARDMERVLSSALQVTRDALDPTAVADAVAQVERETLLRARTPSGLVSVVGRAVDAGGDPAAAARQLDALHRVDAASLRAFLTGLLDRGPSTAEVRP